MQETFRIFKTKHSATWFDGEGARLYGGRWNSQGVRLLYASATLSLAALEMLVHLNSQEVLSAYSFAKIEFPQELVLPVEEFRKLPPLWSASPAPMKIQQIGDEWAASRDSAVLRVPSSIISIESNFLVNLEHPDSAKCIFCKPDTFAFDDRLIRRVEK